MLTLQLKTTRIILINNINNFKPTTFRSRSAIEAHRTRLRVGSAQCLRSPHKLQICGDPERSNRTAKPIVRPKGDKNFLARQGKIYYLKMGIIADKFACLQKKQ